ncbi:MAG: flagellar basal body rod protein FlgB [Planctomycetes bacterium]|nr:flagellar basal body rod protein FlgB [Planctomycetota bacterium]
MFDRIWDNTSVPVIEQAMRFAQLRHNYLANNVANVDTPGYKALDLPESEFREALARAIDDKRSGVTGTVDLKDTARVRSGAGGLRITPVSAGGDTRVDGNDVSLDLELAKLAKNSMEYQVLGRLMARRFAFLRQAVRERLSG